MEALRPDLAGGFPRHRRDVGDGGAIAPRPADRPLAGSAPVIAAQVPDDRLAVVPRHRGDLVQETRALDSRASGVALPLRSQVLLYALARHGSLLS